MSAQYLTTLVIWCDTADCHTAFRGAQGELAQAVRQRSRENGWTRPSTQTLGHSQNIVFHYVDLCPTHSQETP